MKIIILTLLLFFGGDMALADSLILLTPSSVTLEKNSGKVLKGNYAEGKKIDENHIVLNLVSTKVVDNYDEVILLFKDVPSGQYQFRFRKITKPAYGDLEYCDDNTGIQMDSYKRIITSSTARVSVLSAKGSETAEIRLSSNLPIKSYVGYVGAMLPIGPECLVNPPITKLEWLASKKLSTDWATLITVKAAKNLVLRIPKEAYDLAENFELAVILK